MPEPTREEIAKHAFRLIAEIDQIFIDVEHWNSSVRKPEEEPINPDPEGQLKRARSLAQRALLQQQNPSAKQN